MKKLLTILGAVGLVATTGATVIACGNNPTNNGWKGDDISEKKSWNLEPYKTTHKIWIPEKAFKFDDNGALESINLKDQEWSLLLWTGMFDARHNSGVEGRDTAESLKDFNDKKLENFLHFTGNVNDQLSRAYVGIEMDDLVKGISWSSGDEDLRPQNLGIKLDVDVISYTDTKDPQEYGLEHGEIQFEDLKIFLVKEEK